MAIGLRSHGIGQDSHGSRASFLAISSRAAARSSANSPASAGESWGRDAIKPGSSARRLPEGNGRSSAMGLLLSDYRQHRR